MGFLNDHFPRLNAIVNTSYRAFHLYHSNRSSLAWLMFSSHLSQKMFNQSVPPFISIAATYRCQCRCAHCSVTGRRRDDDNELTTGEIQRVIDQAKRLGILQVTFTGGEPLLREDVAELVRYAHDRGLLTRINTNGLLLSRDRVSELKKAGITQCAVSIDDPDPDIHDRLRGVQGLHNRALEGIRNLRRFNILCQINTYASRRIVSRGIEKIIELGRQLGVLCVYIILPVAVGRWEHAVHQLLTEEEKARVRTLQDPTFVHLELSTPLTPCGVSKKGIIFVSPQGHITPCPFVPYAIGNVREDSLDDVWRRHCAELDLVCRGDCIMNDAPFREAIKRHAESIAHNSR